MYDVKYNSTVKDEIFVHRNLLYEMLHVKKA